MSSIPEQLSLASKALFQAQLAGVAAFAQAAFDSGKTAIDLNVAAFKTSLDAASAASSELLAAKDPQEFVSLSTSHSKEALERARDYGQQATSLAQDTRAKLTEVAESNLAASKEKVGDLVEAVKQAPGDAGAPFNSFVKSVFERGQANLDQFTAASKKAQDDATEVGAAAVRSLTPVVS